MSRINLLIDQIIERAQNTADGFTGYPRKIEYGLLETHLTKEEFLRSKIKEEASSEKSLAEYFQVHDLIHLRTVLHMDIEPRCWPVFGANQFPHRGKAKMYCRIFPAILWPLFLRINRINYLKGLIEQTPKPESNTLDELLNSMFNLQDFRLETLKANLNGKSYPITLIYEGTKDKLWIDLGKLCALGIDRNEIKRVFSEYCLWQRTPASEQKKLDPNEIYKKLGKKEILP